MNRPLVHVIDGYPWLRRLPFVGYWGWGELRSITLEINKFIRKEIDTVRQDYIRLGSGEPTNFVEAYLQEIEKVTTTEKRTTSIW